ncbi:hypothetical protein CJ030_MR2G023343 [Morella rubra]|uniref:PB1-like domain-containing protein n=1 Tax=Morella rubra TaxID=262757 RepID=A0A6A1WM49_9ROSI|nr:hypothetical protein CJ030_MR2G023343 [Morella rubra]
MVHVYIHHQGAISYAERRYIGGEIEHCGNEDPDYLSAIVIKNYARKHLGYLNVSRLAWRFYDGGAGEVSYVEIDEDCRYLIDMVRKMNPKELHIYIEHSIDDLVFVTEDENDDGGVDENDDGRDDGGADKNDDGGVDKKMMEGMMEGLICPTLVEKMMKMLERMGRSLSSLADGENRPSGGEDSEDLPSMDEKGEEGVNNQRDRRREFHEEDLDAGKRLRLVKGMKFRDLMLFRRALSTFSIQNGFRTCLH